jgi:YVTN family beta-propeller protein
MMSRIRRTALNLLLIALVAGLSACTADPLKVPLTFVKNIQLPADVGTPAIDLLALDSSAGRLYVPHGSANTLEIIDVKTGKILGAVPGLPSIKAVSLSADPNVIFTANSGDGSVSVLDVKTLKILTNIKMGTGADAIDYDPVHGLVIVSINGDSLGFIDEKTRTKTGELKLPGKPELMAIDRQQGRVFQAINDKDEVLLIDPVTRAVLKTYKGCDIKAPTGVVYDPDNQRLFVADAITHTANVMSVIDVLLDKCLGTIDIDHGPDQAAFNAHLHHLYVANNGSNNLSVIDTNSLKPLGVVGTGKQAATVAADPLTDTVWVAVARAGIIAEYHDP